MRQQPHCQRSCTLTVRRVRNSVVKITVNMNVPAGVHRCLARSDHNTAIAADQQRYMTRLLQVGVTRLLTCSQAIHRPGQLLIRRKSNDEEGSWGLRHLPHRAFYSRLPSVARADARRDRLERLFIAGIRRAASVRNSQNVVCALCCSLFMVQTLSPEEGPACDNRADQKLSTCHSVSQYSRIDT
jgi:hypothetical protein